MDENENIINPFFELLLAEYHEDPDGRNPYIMQKQGWNDKHFETRQKRQICEEIR